MIRGAWDLLVHVVNTAPDPLFPMLAALAMAVLLTQAIKSSGLLDGLTNKQRHRVTQLIAFLCGLGTSFVMWPPHLPWQHGAVAGALVGLAAPAVYPLSMRIIGRRWPWLRERLSGDRPNSEE